jgi:hypothetical protein
LVVDQKELQKGIYPEEEGWVVYLWDKMLFEKNMASRKNQGVHHEEA